MAKAARAGATPLLPSLPGEIVVWEILVLLPPKPLLRCRAVCRAWRRITTTRDFLLAHHGRQPSLPIVCGLEYAACTYQNIVAFDRRAADARLQPVARIGEDFFLEASCDGLLILSKVDMFCSCYFVCNPTTREHAPLRQTWGLRLSGMYPHPSTSEYRLLLHRSSHTEQFLGDLLPKGKIGWYVFTLGYDQPLRYIGGAETASAAQFDAPALVRDSLHWYPVWHQDESKLVLVFDTTTESFRQMRPPLVPSSTTKSYIFEMEGTLGFCSYNHRAMENVDIWVPQNHQGEVWEHKYRVKLPIAQMRGQFRSWEGYWHVSVVPADGDVFLLLRYGRWLFHVDTGGELVDSFRHDSQPFYDCEFRLKQTLVPHILFTALEGYDVNASPFI